MVGKRSPLNVPPNGSALDNRFAIRFSLLFFICGIRRGVWGENPAKGRKGNWLVARIIDVNLPY